MPSVYRARLGKGMDKITLGYVSSMHSDMQILEYDILGSCAHTLMLLKCKIIQKSDAKKILSALNSIKEKDLMRGGESEDVHEIVESIVIRKAGLKSGGRMHTARSRNDQVSLDMRMKMRDDILGICGGILDCTNLLLKLPKNTKNHNATGTRYACTMVIYTIIAYSILAQSELKQLRVKDLCNQVSKIKILLR